MDENIGTAIERIELSREKFYEIETQVRLQEHFRRYAAVRRFIYGRVLDFASGCGYGTYLLSKSPEITEVIGVDKDEQSIAWAKNEYEDGKCRFQCQDVRQVEGPFDTLVSLETIEHFSDDSIYHELIEKFRFGQIILSYPNKKSTHFNPYHLRDLHKQDVCSSLKGYVLLHAFPMGDVDCLVMIRAPEAMPHHLYDNLVDFR